MSKIRKSAKNKTCLIRLPGICNYNDETVVHCHLNGAGLSIKHNDILGARGCSTCHSAIDKLPQSDRIDNLAQAKILLYFHEAIFRTQLELIDEGLL